MKNIIKDWLIVADEDMLVAAALIGLAPIYTSAVTFHCQQAIEKYFKAFLLENGWELKKIYDLKFLYKEIEKIADLKLDKSIITKIYDGYSSAARYPYDYNPPTEEEVKGFYKFAQEVAEKIKQELI